MTIIRTTTEKDSIFYVEIKVTELTQQELALLEAYGEPLIDLGGDFGDFSTPHLYRKLYSDSPFSYFNADEAKTVTWLDVVEGRLFTAIDVLKNLPDDWQGVIIHPLWTGTLIRWKDGELKSVAEKFEEIQKDNYTYLIGNATTNGSWRFNAILGSNLEIETRIDGDWVSKGTWSPT